MCGPSPIPLIRHGMLPASTIKPMENKFVKPETSRVLREEMGYKNKSESCKTCAHYVEVDDPHLDRSWIQACALFRATMGLITIEVTGICRNHKQPDSPCG